MKYLDFILCALRLDSGLAENCEIVGNIHEREGEK